MLSNVKTLEHFLNANLLETAKCEKHCVHGLTYRMPSESIVVPHEDGAATSEQLACYANAHLSTANNPYLVSVIWWDAQSNFFGTDKPKTQEMSEREAHLGNVWRIKQKEQNSFKPRWVRPGWPEKSWRVMGRRINLKGREQSAAHVRCLWYKVYIRVHLICERS